MVATLAVGTQLSKVEPGKAGFIARFTNDQIGCKLLTMGVLPGSRVEVMRTAPFGGGLVVKVDSNYFALREQEAACILLKIWSNRQAMQNRFYLPLSAIQM